jgi:hypothetical protein
VGSYALSTASVEQQREGEITMNEYMVGETVRTQDGEGTVTHVARTKHGVFVDVQFPNERMALAYFPGIDMIEHQEVAA